jgi:spermidine synthase
LGVIGSANTLYLLAAIMLALSLLFAVSRDALMFLGLIIVAPLIVSYTNADTNMHRLDTEYNAVSILNLDSFYNEKKPIRLMRLGNEYSSAMYLDNDSLTFRYTRYYELAMHFNPGLKQTLLIGGAGYSVPKFYQRYYPQVAMDVVEIDPGLTRLAMDYFHFSPTQKVRAIHADGRIFLNGNKKQYEAIFIDAYKSLYSIPFHLVSQEAWQKVAQSLDDHGFVQANVLSAIEGKHNELLTSIIKTARKSFPVVKIFKVDPGRPKDVVQNVMLVCFKSEPHYSSKSYNFMLNKYLKNEIDVSKLDFSNAILLTDDFAPVEHFGEKMIAAYAQ